MLVILDEPAASCGPCEGPFYDRSTRQQATELFFWRGPAMAWKDQREDALHHAGLGLGERL